MLGDAASWNMATGMDTASSVNTLTLANGMVITKDFSLYLLHSYLFLLHNLSFLCPLLSVIMVTQIPCIYQSKREIQCTTLTSKHEFIFTDFYA